MLYGVDLSVPRGSVVALSGPNGAGKTTTLRVASALHSPTGGDVLVAGRRVNGARPEELARHGLCLVPEGRGIFPNLSVRENLRMMTYSGQSMRAVEEITFERFPRLRDRRVEVAGTLSGGEQQMLAMALVSPLGRRCCSSTNCRWVWRRSSWRSCTRSSPRSPALGVSILVVEQFARTVLGVADYAAIMVHGRIAKVGRPSELEAELSTAYLGA